MTAFEDEQRRAVELLTSLGTKPSAPGRHRSPVSVSEHKLAPGRLQRTLRLHGRRVVVFGAIGLTVFIAGSALQWGLLRLGVSSDLSYAAQTVFSAVLSYLLNRWLTWRDRHAPVLRSAIRWAAQRVTLIPNIALYGLLVRGVHLQWMAANAIATAVFTGVNYLAGDLWSFRARQSARLQGTRRKLDTALKPRYWPFVVSYLILLVATAWFTAPTAGILGWPLTLLWSWPVLNTIISVRGISRARRRFRNLPGSVPRCTESLVVVIPTIGRLDVLPALRRSVFSCLNELEPCFPRLRMDILIEEGCAGEREIRAIAAWHPDLVRIVVVPACYRTVRRSRFKARANQYSADLLTHEGMARDDVWVLHMDDDTGLGPGAASEIARFINNQPTAGDPRAKHLAQGILAYPRESAQNKLFWLADAVRPADDISRFCAWTGGGTPRAGLHGEFLLIRASFEVQIGWDFGPDVLVEDAYFATVFSNAHPGRSDWLAACCLGASPATFGDFIRQRERWAWGILQLAFNPSLPWRSRLYLGYSMLTWVMGPFQNIFTVLAGEALLLTSDSSPSFVVVVAVWSLNLAFYVWCYWEGLRVNAAISATRGRKWWESLAVLALMPVFSMLEGIGGLCGLYKFSTRDEAVFTVIAKHS
jgi:beta-1,4-mannosyltransferase